ncbi:hypothetical protein [Haloprofundus salilacus]|uniref:hypothetical protein n=1 Tax=Haloprofundus salilacus TaxID=2876190 RepID=UPI001CCF1B3B|nr:hypothetical protein [Haloprofundus salilacus]
MTRHISSDQVRSWLDDQVVRDVQRVSSDESEFNFQVELSRLPLHVIKEETWGPIRLVGNNAFDTDDVRGLVENDEQREELLTRFGPVLAATPGFYTFLDEEGVSCPLAEAHSIQLEHRIYPDGASQQALMSGLMAIATAMRYLQNTVAEMPRDWEE